MCIRDRALPARMPESLRATIASGSSALARVASLWIMPITRNGSPPWRAFRNVVTLMSPIWTSFFCIEVTICVPMLTTFSLTSTPCFQNRPFSTPTNIGRWPKLLPTTASMTGSVCAAAPPTAQSGARASSTAPNRLHRFAFMWLSFGNCPSRQAVVRRRLLLRFELRYQVEAQRAARDAHAHLPLVLELLRDRFRDQVALVAAVGRSHGDVPAVAFAFVDDLDVAGDRAVGRRGESPVDVRHGYRG